MRIRKLNIASLTSVRDVERLSLVTHSERFDMSSADHSY